MTKEQLIPIAKPYFDTDKTQESICVTIDGQFFWKSAYAHALNHVHGAKENVFEITRSEAMNGRTKTDEEIVEEELEKEFVTLVTKGDKFIENKKKNYLNNALLKYEEALVLKPEDSALLQKIADVKSQM